LYPRPKDNLNRAGAKQLNEPSQTLAASEVEAFLQFLFSDIAQRPKQLPLREGAAVARYLNGLSWELRGAPGASELARMVDVIWGTIFLHAPFKLSTKRQVIQFLEKHRRTYLVSFDVPAATEMIKQSPEPQKKSAYSPAPLLMSEGLSVQGYGDPHVKDDLTERIYAAYYLLRRSSVKNARRQIATALNKLSVQSRTQGTPWDSYAVAERVKQYEASVRKKSPTQDKDVLIAYSRKAAADRWLFSFRSAEEFKVRKISPHKPEPSE